jgi:MoxR-like ATPase
MAKKDKKPEGEDSKPATGVWRLFEWRRNESAEPLPPLLTAMRQLRQHILDAQGDGIAPFVERAQAIAAQARESGEHETSAILLKLAAIAELGRDRDVRAVLLDLLDEAHAALNPPSE